MRHESFSPLDQTYIGPQLLKTAEERALIIREEYSPSLQPFMDEDVYGRKAVFEDLNEVRRLELQFSHRSEKEKTDKRISDIFETYYVDAATKLQWFGPGSKVRRTTRFDDYKNGVDAITSFQDGRSRYDHLAMSTDLTFGIDASMNKIEGVLHDINAGRMSKIRYFHSPETGHTGQLANLPKTIIGLDKEHLPDFIRFWTHDQASPELIEIRNILISQLHHQLRAFTAYADRKHGESKIRSSYARASQQVTTIYNNLQLSEKRVPMDEITRQVTNL